MIKEGYLMDDVYLFQTDTTVGLASQNYTKLADIKSRDFNKPFLRLFSSFESYKLHGGRIPKKFKNTLRRTKKTTFIVNENAIRISKPVIKSTLINNLIWFYSTSANAKSSHFDRTFCEEMSDITIEDSRGLFETEPSRIYKINNKKMRRLR